MKYKRTPTPQRTKALFLALNWFLTDKYDDEHMEEYMRRAENEVCYTGEEVSAHLAKRYVGRFRTARLRKKHAHDLYWLAQSQHIDWKRFES